MFETYVSADGSAEHILPQAGGMLGVLTPQLRASLRQRLRAEALK